MKRSLEERRADIKKRNAEAECVTVWNDGTWVHHGLRDAEEATLSEPDKVLLTIRLDNVSAVTFMKPQDRINLYQKMFAPNKEPK